MKNPFKKYNHFPNKIDQFREFDLRLKAAGNFSKFVDEIKKRIAIGLSTPSQILNEKYNPEYIINKIGVNNNESIPIGTAVDIQKNKIYIEMVNDGLGNTIEVTDTSDWIGSAPQNIDPRKRK